MVQPQPFDWRDYITLREPNPQHRAQFSAILDRIAQTPEGRELIRKAKEVSGSGRNNVELGATNAGFTVGGAPATTPNWGSIGSADILRNPRGEYEGKLVVALQHAGTVGYFAPDGKPVIASQTHILVHELYHLADPNHLPHVTIARYRGVIRDALSHIVRTEGATEAARNAALDAATTHAMSRLDLTMETRLRDPSHFEIDKVRTSFVTHARRLASDETFRAEAFRGVVIPVRVERAQDEPQAFASLRGSNAGQDDYPRRNPSARLVPGPHHEEQDVDFTDAFMGRYFGEAPRQGYGNIFRIDPTPRAAALGPAAVAAPREPELLSTPVPLDRLPRYTPDAAPANLGNLPSPIRFAPQPATPTPTPPKR